MEPFREHILQFFGYAHLPPAMQAVSKPFGDLAEHIAATVPRNPERTVALRKLLEAKDAAVRAFIAKDAVDTTSPLGVMAEVLRQKAAAEAK